MKLKLIYENIKICTWKFTKIDIKCLFYYQSQKYSKENIHKTVGASVKMQYSTMYDYLSRDTAKHLKPKAVVNMKQVYLVL